MYSKRFGTVRPACDTKFLFQTNGKLKVYCNFNEFSSISTFFMVDKKITFFHSN